MNNIKELYIHSDFLEYFFFWLEDYLKKHTVKLILAFTSQFKVKCLLSFLPFIFI